MALVEDAAKAGTVKGEYRKIGLAVEAALARRTEEAQAADECRRRHGGDLLRPRLSRAARPRLFLLSRAVGLLAHAWEQMNEGKRIKGPLPAGWLYAYTGPPKRDVT